MGQIVLLVGDFDIEPQIIYFDHREEIRHQVQADEDFVAEMKREQGVIEFDSLEQL